MSAAAVLCPLTGDLSRYLGTKSLECLRSGVCYRLDRPRAEALEEGMLFAPGVFRTPVLVFDACSVLPATDERVAPPSSMGGRLISEAVTGVILCNTEVSIADAPRNAHLLERLRSGAPAGEAAAEFNRAAAGDEATRSIILIGDPDFRLAPPASDADEARVGESRVSRKALFLDETHFTDLSFVRTVGRRMRSESSGGARAITDRCLALLDLLEDQMYAVSDGNLRTRDDLATLVHRCALSYAAALAAVRHATYDYWLNLSVMHDHPAPASCFYCSAEMNSNVAQFPHPAVRRVLHICPNCGASADLPEGADVTFRRAGEREFSLAANYKGLPAHARLYTHAPYAAGRRVWRWPFDRDAGARPRMEVRKELPPAPWLVGVFVSWGVQFANLSAPTLKVNWPGAPETDAASSG
jgi:hypothetical protein